MSALTVGFLAIGGLPCKYKNIELKLNDSTDWSYKKNIKLSLWACGYIFGMETFYSPFLNILEHRIAHQCVRRSYQIKL